MHFDVHLLGVDLARDVATFTVLPDLTSPSIATKGRLNNDLSIEVDTGAAVFTHKFKKGESPGPWSMNVPIDFGDVLDYPFDKHGGNFFVKINSDGATNTIANLDLDKVMHGFVATARAEPLQDKSQMEVSFEIARSPAVIFLASMAMLALALVVFSAVAVAKHVAINGRKVEFGMLVWIAALLFVIPAVCNSLPSGPPLGALIDIGLFFWRSCTAGQSKPN